MTTPAGTALPIVSVVLTTHERPRFLPVALACYQQQTYPTCELVVVDDGSAAPAREAAVAAAGGRLLRLPPGTPLGSKLNAGLALTSGPLCLKMDDDWYAPAFLETLVTKLLARDTEATRSMVACLAPFLFFRRDPLGATPLRRP